MTDDLQLTLHVAPDDEPIRGRVVTPDGAVHDFRGWLQLAVVLDDVRRVGTG